MTKDEIILANKEFLFPSVFHYFKEPLVVSHAKSSLLAEAVRTAGMQQHDRRPLAEDACGQLAAVISAEPYV